MASEGINRTIAEAYDETVTIQRCSTCGETNENNIQAVYHDAKYTNVEYEACSCGQLFCSVNDLADHQLEAVLLARTYMQSNYALYEAIQNLHSSSGSVTWHKLVSEPYYD